jgi:RNA polymerase-binding transcription factor DksA
MAEETANGMENSREKKLRERLRATLESVRGQLDELEGNSRDIGDFASGIDEPLIVPWELSPAREDQLRERATELEDALERLEAGTYGICESCGQPIDIERLEALPQSRLCIDCARRQEAGRA